MALCHNCDDVSIEYTGDGSQTDFTFQFEYNLTTDVEAAFWSEEELGWRRTSDWTFLNDTTIQFNEAPPADTRILIYRCTDTDPLPATFHPGHSIKAQDLNDNFDILQMAVEEAKCQTNIQNGKNNNKFWNKVTYTDEEDNKGDTVYSIDRWQSSDEAVATTKASEQRFWNKAEETTTTTDRWETEADDEHTPTTGAVQRWVREYVANDDGIIHETEIIKYDEQVTGSADAAISDKLVFSSKAAKARHDAYTQDPRPDDLVYEQSGKRWYDTTTLETYTWDKYAEAWVSVARVGQTGSEGEQGPVGPAGRVLISDTPPTVYEVGDELRPLEAGDQWFNSEKTQLYIYYIDNFGPPQWVSISVPGPEGPMGDGDYVFVNPLVQTDKNITFEIDKLLTLPV